LLHLVDPKKDLPNELKFIPIHRQPASPRSLARSTTASIATGTPATPWTAWTRPSTRMGRRLAV